MLTRIFRYLYLVVSWLFLVGVVVQVYTAGLAAVAETHSWTTHGEFGFLILLAGLVQLLMIWPARLPRPAGLVSIGLFVTLILQLFVFFDRENVVSALHPVLALLVFSLAWWLALAAFRAVRSMKPKGSPDA